MDPPIRSKTPLDESLEELAVATRSVAKRANALFMTAATRNVPDTFRRATHKATELLDDAATSLTNPNFRIRGLSLDREEARAIAREMASVEPHATSVIPPLKLMQEQSAISVLSGSTRAVPVPELLEFLGTLKKSGILWVISPKESITLQLEDGYLVHASSSASPPGSRLGDVLVALKIVTQDRLDEFLASFKMRGPKLGVALEQAGMVSSKQLADALEHQVHLLFQRLLAMDSASFSFSERKLSTTENRFRLGITHLLLESARVNDEINTG